MFAGLGDGLLVVRTAALDDLKARASESSSADQGKPSALGKTSGESPLLSYDLAEQDFDTKAGRRRAVDALLAHCNSQQEHKVMRSHIWRAAGYSVPKSFEDWQAMAPKASKACHTKIHRILAMSATAFLAELKRKHLIED